MLIRPIKKFKKELNRTEDISLSGFTEKVDKEYDYPNIISVVIDWRAIIYYRDSGITDIYSIIDKVTLFMDYAYQDLENDNISGDREYNLVIDDFELTNSFERDSKSYEDRKWISNDEKIQAGIVVKAIIKSIEYFTKYKIDHLGFCFLV